MLYEILVGLEVIDDEVYQAYRDAMKPILLSYQGQFSYDFKVEEVLKSGKNINRVFTIQFPSEAVMNSFFSDPKYLEVKQEYFEKSVRQTTIIASYTKQSN